MTRNNVPIESHGLRHAINPNIGFSMRYREIETCVECGLDAWLWETGAYPVDFKELMIAYHETRITIMTHAEDAKARDYERRSKKGSGRR